MTITGAVETVTPRGLAGWCHDDQSDVPVSLSVWCDDLRLANIRADRPHSKGRIGFRFRLSPKLLNYLPKGSRISVRVNETMELPASDDNILTLSFATGTSLEAIKRRLSGGEIISAKKGGLIRPIGSRPEWQNQVLTDYQHATKIFEEKFGRPLWLGYGTLLGCIRDQDFIPHDDDFDVCFLSRGSTVEEAANEYYDIFQTLVATGDIVRESMPGHFHWKLSRTCAIDVFMIWHDEDGHFGYNFGGHRDGLSFEPIKRHQFKGFDVWIPSNHETFLEFAYGPGWRVPDPGFQWRVSSDARAKLLRLKSLARPTDTLDSRKLDRKSALKAMTSGNSAPEQQDKTELEYWEQYYAHQTSKRIIPSQFAAFVAGETPDKHQVIDVGCGTGRDALFFAQCGHRVIGVDAAASAIKICQQHASVLQTNEASFVCGMIDQTLFDTIRKQINRDLPLLIYARFFLHAIDEKKQSEFFRFCADLCAQGGRIAVEFRTMRDAEQPKVTESHYRRFIDPLHVLSEARDRGLNMTYFVEGFGYAKYRDDDAHVARCLFERTGPRAALEVATTPRGPGSEWRQQRLAQRAERLERRKRREALRNREGVGT